MIANTLLIGALLTLATPSLSRAIPSSLINIQLIEALAETLRNNAEFLEKEAIENAKPIGATQSDLIKNTNDLDHGSIIPRSIALQLDEFNSVNDLQDDNGRLYGKRQINPESTDYDTEDDLPFTFPLKRQRDITRRHDDHMMLDLGRARYDDENVLTPEQLAKRDAEDQIRLPQSFESSGDTQLVRRTPEPDPEEEFEKRETRSKDAQSLVEDDTRTSHQARSLDRLEKNLEIAYHNAIYPRDSGNNHHELVLLIPRNVTSAHNELENDGIMAREVAPQGHDRQILGENMDVVEIEKELTRRSPEPQPEPRIVCYDFADCEVVEGVNPLADHEINW